MLGGGASGNQAAWVDAAIAFAQRRAEHAGLDVRLVSHGATHPVLEALERSWARNARPGL